MKIDRSKLKKNSADPPGDCSWLIERLRTCTDEELLPLLMGIESWSYGKCELHHWVDVLDRFDSILEAATKREDKKWVLPCNMPNNNHMHNLVIYVLHFTTLLVEHSFSRHLYSSVEHLITLLSSSTMSTVLSVLNLLYMFSKRSNFITRLQPEPRQQLISRLIHLAESWGGKENGFGLAHCCKDLVLSNYPEGATNLSFEYFCESNSDPLSSTTNLIHIPDVHLVDQTPSEIMEDILSAHNVPEDKKMLLFTHLRLAHSFGRYESRLQCVQARLQSISILVYCNALQDSAHTVLYTGLLEEFVDVLEVKDNKLTEIKAATLRTLTSIIHLERLPNFPKLNTIIDVTGAASYHGFLPVLVRSCITALIAKPVDPNPFPSPLATSLFSFLYHLASYESGGDALVSCGMMESLLSVVNWIGTEPDHITFVTRAVRVIDLITNLDMNAFQNHNGLNNFIKRLEFEVDQCRKEQPYVIEIPVAPLATVESDAEASTSGVETSTSAVDEEMRGSSETQKESSPMEVEETIVSPEIVETPVVGANVEVSTKSPTSCLPQRAALLKSMLNFLKKDIQDPSFNESMRHLMEGSLPNTLKHIISNAEYYGPSLFLLATDVVTAYVFGEPSLLSSLQDNGLTDVVLHALLIKDVPATREVLGSLPNVFSALCLNSRGLQSFVVCKPFERLFKVLLSPDYLPAMRRRRSSDPMGDTASNLGSAMDELMRHQPSLKSQSMKAIVKLLEELCVLGSDKTCVCSKTNPKSDELPNTSTRNAANDSSSDEDEEEEETEPQAAAEEAPADKRSVPLVDYILNVMKFVDAILSNNSTDDHCKEFVAQKGLSPLLGILGLPNLPLDFASSHACLAVSSVCKSILNLAHEKGVLQQGLTYLNEKLESLAPLHQTVKYPGGSVLLKELIAAESTGNGNTPLQQTLSSVHAYILMLSQVCRTSQNDIRQLAMKQWGTELGLKVLTELSSLYSSIVSESCILFALCSEQSNKKDDEENYNQMDVSDLEQKLTEISFNGSPFDSSASKTIASCNDKYIKPLLEKTTRIGKTLADLFSLLIKLCVGSPLRQRRGQQVSAAVTPPSPSAIAVAGGIANVIYNAFGWVPNPPTALPRFRKAFLVSSMRFSNPLLFDDKKMPYHLMIHEFIRCDGLTSFFETFEWALDTAEDSEGNCRKAGEDEGISEFMGEFIDTWLFLLEKLISPNNMLDSPHLLPSKFRFCPLKFLIHIQKRAFDAVMKLWNKKPFKMKSGVKISEQMLTILCHILRGEKILAKKLEKEKSANESKEPVATSTSEAVDVAFSVPLTVQALPGVDESLRQQGTGERNTPPGPSGLETSFPSLTMAPTQNQQSGENMEQTEAIATPAAETATESTEVVQPISSAPSSSTTTNSASSSQSASTYPLLQPLLDMGFPRERCMDAMAYASSLEQATEYLLSMQSGDNEMEWSEDDQLLQAVAMSIKENLQQKTVPKSDSPLKQVSEEPLGKDKLDEFCSIVLDGCLEQLDAQPELVYKACELITTCAQRNGKEWKEELLKRLMKEVQDIALHLKWATSQAKTIEDAKYLCHSNTASKFGNRLHLVTLLFEDMKSTWANALEEAGLVNILIELMCSTQHVIGMHALSPQLKTPKKDNEKAKSNWLPWLPPNLLLIDLYEKYSVALRRRAGVKKVTNHVWKWFDVNAIQWYSYGPPNNNIIDEAYWAGESSCRIVTGRKKYTIQFNNMTQVNEETYFRRPIMICISDKAIAEERTKMGIETPKEKNDADEMKTDAVNIEPPIEKRDSIPESEKEKVEDPAPLNENKTEEPSPPEPEIRLLPGLSEDQQEQILRVCVGFMKMGMDPDTLHALMVLVLRITRDWRFACMFSNLGGIRTLLALSDSSNFFGFHTLSALLMRHILEEPSTLKSTMKKVVRSACNSTSLGAKEIHSLLRTLAPAACRDSQLFVETAKQFLRIDLSTSFKRRITGSATSEESTFMKSIHAKTTLSTSQAPSEDNTEPQALINDLLESLATTREEPPPDNQSNQKKDNKNFAVVSAEPGSVDLSRSSSANDMVVQELMDQVKNSASEISSTDPKGEKADETKKKPLVSRAFLCKLLAEFVRSYGGVAKVLSEFMYHAGINEYITEDCSAVSFLLDHFVCGDNSEMTNKVRVLIAALASCNHSIDAQTALVSEVKNCFSRVMALPESPSKHTKLQNLVSTVSTMIESCPSQYQQVGPNCVKHPGQSTGMNNIIKILIKKNVVTDLARIPHCLDLTSPNMAATVNAALKPLDNILRVISTPCLTPASKKKNAPQDDNQQQSENNTTNSEATHAQGEDNAEDAENTEHDISGAAESLEPNSEANPNDNTLTSDGIEEILGQLLEDRGSRSLTRNQGMAASVTYVLDDDTPMDTDETLHDSRMVSHSESQFMEENDPNNEDDNSSTEDENDADDNDDVDDEEDDDDDDDDEGADDDEEGSVFDEGYEDLDEPFLQLGQDLDMREDSSNPFMPSYRRYINTIDTIIFGDRLDSYSQQSNHDDLHPFLPSTSNATNSNYTPSSVPTHPLFQNPRDNVTSSRASCRPSRQRGVLRYQTISRPRSTSATTTILQRLLGQSQREVLSLTSNLREVFISNGEGFVVQSDSEDFLDNQDSTVAHGTRVPIPVPVPNALARWTEESKVLELDSMNDAVTELKPALLAVLEKYRNEEVAEKEKKKQEELAASSKAEEGTTNPESSAAVSSTATSDTMTVAASVNTDTPSSVSATTTAIISFLDGQRPESVPFAGLFGDLSPSIALQEPSVLSVPERPILPALSDTDLRGLDLSMSTPPNTTSVRSSPVMSVQESSSSDAIMSLPELSQNPDQQQTAQNMDGQQQQQTPNEQPPHEEHSEQNPETNEVGEQVQQQEDMCISPPEFAGQSMDTNGRAEINPAPLVENPTDSNAESSEIPESEDTSRNTEVATPSTSTAPNEYASILGDIEIPEGVDPSFLAALPDEMRQEVISEQLRIQQVTRRAAEARQQETSTQVAEVSPDFLAALPPNIQEEVLEQQRMEQQRQTPHDDHVSFLQTLPSSLRQTILADLEESQISALPPEIAQEAQRLRSQREERTRNVSEHMFRGTNSSLSHILRNSARLDAANGRFLRFSSWNLRPSNSNQQVAAAGPKIKGQQILDCEAISCLLVLIFVDEPKLNTARLQRVLKTLCCYGPTRDWIIKTLLSILDRCGENNIKGIDYDEDLTSTPVTSTPWKSDSRAIQQTSWLNMSIDAALGCRTNIFQLKKSITGGKKNPNSIAGTVVHIHPQAAALVCRHVIDLLVSLAKVFPNNFLPTIKEGDKDPKKTPKKTPNEFPDFWDILVKLDAVNVSKKSKSVPKVSISVDDYRGCLITSPLGMLVQHLAHPVIKKSSLLTDKLLRLLALVAITLSATLYATDKKHVIPSSSIPALEKLLALAVQVLTTKSCTEEGLEDITSLVIHLSHGPPPTRDIVLKLLLEGAVTLGKTVTSHIAALLRELKQFNASHPHTFQDDDVPQIEKTKKGVLKDRFTQEEVVITSSKTKKPCEIQLPSMSALISKTSSQAFFLRTLKVILQLRNAIRMHKTMKNESNNSSQPTNEASNRPALPAESTDTQLAEATDSENKETSQEPSSESSHNQGTESTPSSQTGESSEQTVPAEPASTAVVTMEASQKTESLEAMEVDQEIQEEELKSLCSELQLDTLWSTLSDCLVELGETPDTHAVLVLQPAVEAFFLVHAFHPPADAKPKSGTSQETREAQLAHLHNEIAPLSPLPASATEDDETKIKSDELNSLNVDAEKFIKFGEMHRSVLNQILRQSTVHLADGPFRVLVDHTRLLDYDIKRKYFRTELERADEGIRREELAVHVRREHVFEDSYRELHRRPPEEWKNRFYIVFEGEEGQDAGGLLREWYVIISREIFNPMYALFCTSPGDRVTYMINPSSHCNSNHLSYFKFVGRVIAKAIYDNKLLECYFTRSFYKHILGKMVRVSDMESEDYSFYQGLIYLIEHHVADLGYELTFSTEVQEFGVTEVRDLKPDGRNIAVTEETKMEYIRLVCQEKMKGAIKQQLNSFLEGFYDIIPKRLISIFNEQELELLISGLPSIDIDDLKNNTEYHKYNSSSLQIQWFWRSLRSFEQADKAKLVQFVTGTSKVPLQGFAALEGMNGVQKFQIHKDERSTDRLPSAHTCFNQLDLPVYETYDKLRHYLLKAIQECSEGFGFA